MIIGNRPILTVFRLLCSALTMGLGIAAMHCSGMSAIQIAPMITYQKPLVLLSIALRPLIQQRMPPRDWA
jgi:NO-binding membrane sensor protein with MHYT domain